MMPAAPDFERCGTAVPCAAIMRNVPTNTANIEGEEPAAAGTGGCRAAPRRALVHACLTANCAIPALNLQPSGGAPLSMDCDV
jgi:hypothetical protein